jgi:hypothetical protein
MIARYKWNYETKILTMRTVQWTTILIEKDTSETIKLNIPTRRTVQWITVVIARHKWNYETKIPTMRTVQWTTIRIARHQWN